MNKSLFIAAALIVTPAVAQPPEGADMRYAPFYHSLEQPITGWPCCSVSDCRPIADDKIRFTETAIEVFIDKKTFGNTAPDEWVKVPENRIIQHDDPKNDPSTGLDRPQNPIVCWYNAEIRCFQPPSWGG